MSHRAVEPRVGIRAVPFNRPSATGHELTLMAAALDSGRISGGGPFASQCQACLESIVGARRALLTTSCTHALEMAAILLDLGRDDEVIVPSFTFVSSASAIAMRGARPVFADIRPDTLNLDETRLEAMVSSRTKAIVVVHYAGVGCEMDAIMRFANAHGLAVVEDNAHGFLASYRGRPLGSFGVLSALSFHETKNITCGEGGALLVNSDAFRERAEIVRDRGTDRSRFLRGEVDKYTWVDLGSSYLQSDVLAAFLLAQLQRRRDIQEKRRRIWNRYFHGLKAWASARHVSLPTVPAHVEQSFHLFYLLLPSNASRDSLLHFLRRHEISAAFHYQPLHTSPFGRQFPSGPGGCPVTEDVSARLLRLPFFTSMSDADVDTVIEAVEQFA